MPIRPERSGTPRPESIRPCVERLGRKRHRHPDDGGRTRPRLGPENRTPPVVANPGTGRGQPRAGGEEGACGHAEGQDHENPADQAPAPEEDQRRRAEEKDRDRGEDRRSPGAEEKRNLELLRHREGRDAIGGIALEEVEDLVAARVEARREGRPGDRRLRGHGREQRRIGAPGLQRGEIRQLPPRQHLLDDVRVDAVEAEDHDPAGKRRGRRRDRGHRGRDERPENQRGQGGSKDSHACRTHSVAAAPPQTIAPPG